MRFKCMYLKRIAYVAAVWICFIFFDLLIIHPPQPFATIKPKIDLGRPEYTVKYLADTNGYMFYSKTASLAEAVYNFNAFLIEVTRRIKRKPCENCQLPCERANRAGKKHPSFKKVRVYDNLPGAAHKYKFFQYMQTKIHGLHTFIINWKTDSFLSDNGDTENDQSHGSNTAVEYAINDLPFTNEFYPCVSGRSLHAIGGFRLGATSQTQIQCIHNCSEDMRDWREPVPIWPHELYTDYSKLSYWSTCDYFANRTLNPEVMGSVQSDILTALDMVSNGGLVHKYGYVFTNSRAWIASLSCGYKSKYRGLEPCNATAQLDKVFVITQRPAIFNHYHFLIEMMPRLAAFVPFLKANPRIYIHTRQESFTVMPVVLKVFGLLNPVTYGFVQANTIYVPHGGGCLNAHFSSIQLTAVAFRKYIRRNLLSTGPMPGFKSQPVIVHVPNPLATPPPLVLLMKRHYRRLNNHDAVVRMLDSYKATKSFELVIFDDAQLPSMEQTMTLFHRAALVLGPHGAGFSNILYSLPGTVVIDIQCCCYYMRTCYKNLALKLGMRYYAMATATGKAQSRKCEYEGVQADMEELGHVLDYVFKHIIR